MKRAVILAISVIFIASIFAISVSAQEGQTDFSKFVDWIWDKLAHMTGMAVVGIANEPSISAPRIQSAILTSCQDLNQSDTVYQLASDVNSSGTCFNITANNVTLDCQGYSITGSGVVGNGVSNYGYNYTIVENCNISGFDAGIEFENGASHGIITNNNVFYNLGGIALRSSSNNNSLIGNTAGTNSFNGIYLDGSSGNNLTGNTVSGNFYVGIALSSSSYNTIANNDVSENIGVGTSTGISLDSSSDYNTISGNTISNNSAYGFFHLSSSGNMVYNNFLNNTNNTGLNGIVSWNTTLTPGTNIVGGSLLGGNFWADPTGTGFSETCSDSNADGICDSGYQIDANNTDYLPLSAQQCSAPTVDVNGIWDGTWQTSAFGGLSGTFNVDITQHTSTLSGTITVDVPPIASPYVNITNEPLTGRLCGNGLTFGDIGGGILFNGTTDGSSASGDYILSASSFSHSGIWQAAKKVSAPSSGGGGGGGGGHAAPKNITVCVEDWTCGNWSECSGGMQERLCRDLGRCNTTVFRPTLTKTCQMPAPQILVTPPVQGKSNLLWLWILIALALLAAGGFLGRRMIAEGLLRRKVRHMKSAIAAGDAAEVRKTYSEIRQIYEKMPDKKKSKYYDQILNLYKNSL